VIGYIIREVAGWGLILVGLWLFYMSYTMITPGWEWVPNPDREKPGNESAPTMIRVWHSAKILSAPPVALMGFVIFRGGIHLLKVAVAARASQQARRDLLEAVRRPRLPQPARVPVKT
jgi:hypothetical protein